MPSRVGDKAQVAGVVEDVVVGAAAAVVNERVNESVQPSALHALTYHVYDVPLAKGEVDEKVYWSRVKPSWVDHVASLLFL